jgi:hypothetical protein
MPLLLLNVLFTWTNLQGNAHPSCQNSLILRAKYQLTIGALRADCRPPFCQCEGNASSLSHAKPALAEGNTVTIGCILTQRMVNTSWHSPVAVSASCLKKFGGAMIRPVGRAEKAAEPSASASSRLESLLPVGGWHDHPHRRKEEG